MNNVIMTPLINELATALCKAQGAIKNAKKSSDNPFYKSKYEDLAEVLDCCKEPLYANGLSLIQCPSAVGNQVTLKTIIMHVSGQYISSDLTVTSKDGGPQAIGSCISYCRRYAIKAMLCIASEDDDGETAEKRPTITGSSVYDGKNKELIKIVKHHMDLNRIPTEQRNKLSNDLVGKRMADIALCIEHWQHS